MLMQGTWQMMTFGVYSPYVGTPFSWHTHTHTYIYIYTLYTCRIIHTWSYMYVRIVYFIFILLYTHTCTSSPHIWSCSYSGQTQGLFRSLVWSHTADACCYKGHLTPQTVPLLVYMIIDVIMFWMKAMIDAYTQHTLYKAHVTYYMIHSSRSTAHDI